MEGTMPFLSYCWFALKIETYTCYPLGSSCKEGAVQHALTVVVTRCFLAVCLSFCLMILLAWFSSFIPRL